MFAKHGEAPGRLTGGLLQALWLNGSNGGRGWFRTSDLSDVNRERAVRGWARTFAEMLEAL